MRINKYIASSTMYSRRKADEVIKDGRVKVNSQILKDLSYDVQPSDRVFVDDVEIKPIKKHHYYLFNKPAKVITSVDDEKGRLTVIDFFPPELRLYPVGRLDYESRGLLIVTDDGEMTQRITHPKNQVDKVYYVQLNDYLTSSDMKNFEKGVPIDGRKTAPAKIKLVNYNTKLYKVTIHEGRNRQIRKMMEFFGKKVIDLERISIGQIEIGALKEGKFRKLTETEIEYLKNL